MRYRSKVTATLWVSLCSALGWIVLGLLPRAGGVHRLFAAAIALISLQTLALQIFSFWEIHPDGLYERRLWSTRTIPFSLITGVHQVTLDNGKLRPGWLGIDLDRAAPLAEHKPILLVPAHSGQFLSALRHAAPQATFDTI
jgi:hypothetical protein